MLNIEIPSVGGDILGLITGGMYDDPMAIYREYVQNSFDSITAAGGDGQIDVMIDPVLRKVIIRDDGPGLTEQEARRRLVPIGASEKTGSRQIGFRGIGRLAGLAFATSVIFRTRSQADTPIIQVTWNGAQLKRGIEDGIPLQTLLSRSISEEFVQKEGYPPAFFEVEVSGVSRYAAGSILNPDAVGSYISQICPVPFRPEFPYAEQVSGLFESGERLITISVFIQNGQGPIRRPHLEGVPHKGRGVDPFQGFERIDIPQIGTGQLAAIGWVGHSSYLGALAKSAGVRCIRARVGNMQIGGEDVFDHLFQDSRFNRWCIGEVHILDSRIRPNGRRDYFEISPHVRNLENHLGAVCRRLEQRCRASSSRRIARRQIESMLDELQKTYDLASSGYLTACAARDLMEKKGFEIERFRKRCGALEDSEFYMNALDRWEEKFRCFRARRGRPSFFGIKPSEAPIYREVFQTLTKAIPSSSKAKEVIEAVLNYKQDGTPP